MAWENQSLVEAAGREPPAGREWRLGGGEEFLSAGEERRVPSRSGLDFIESAIRFRLRSTSITVVCTFWPTFTTSEASLTK